MEKISYLDFDLLIDHFGDKYKGRVLNSPAGQAATEFDTPFSADELREFWSKIDAFTPQKDSALDQTLKKFGGRLFETVFAGQVRSCFGACVNEASREGAGLRLRLRLSEAPELAALPWEYFYDPLSNRFLSLSNQTPVVRYLDLPQRIKPLTVQPPLRMLVMVSSPWDLPPLEVEQEWENVKNALAEAERRGLVQLERLETATLPALQKRLREKKFHLFHFIGHGDFDQQMQAGVLYLENEDKKKRAVSGDSLGALLHDEETLRLAALNSCRGSRSAGRDPFSGMAQRLVQQGIPAVIAMQAPISDAAALTFSQEFYSALAFGYPVDAAVSEARKAIFSQGNEVEWGTPVLYMRAPDGRIFDMSSASDNDGKYLKTKNGNRKTKDARRKMESEKSEKQTESPSTVQQSVTGAGGQVIQAGRDVVITQPENKKEAKKNWIETTQAKLTLVATILGIIITTFTLKDSLIKTIPSSRFQTRVVDRDSNTGIGDVAVQLLEIDGKQAQQTVKTSSDGSFVIKVAAEAGTKIRLSFEHSAYQPYNQYYETENPEIIYLERVK